MNRILYLNVEMFENENLYKMAYSMVSNVRKEKIDKMKSALPARLSMGAGVLLHIAIKECGLLEKQDKIEYGKHGKPYLKNTDFHFSLSHSGDYAVCAYSDAPIGVDIQKIKMQMPKYTSKILSKEEKEYLDTLEETERNKNFYYFWSRKESLAKWDGRGIRIPLNELSFVHNHKIVDTLEFEGKTLYFKDVFIYGTEYAFSVCSEKVFQNRNIVELTGDNLNKLLKL